MLIGKVHGSRRVEAEDGNLVLAVCECGRREWTRYSNLRRSKGCVACAASRPKPARRIHLLHLSYDTYRRIYGCAYRAILRCNAGEGSYHWKYYGAKGVKVLFASLEEFVEYLATLPGFDDPDLMLDREDNHGHYAVGNLRFVTHTESQLNRG